MDLVCDNCKKSGETCLHMQSVVPNASDVNDLEDQLSGMTLVPRVEDLVIGVSVQFYKDAQKVEFYGQVDEQMMTSSRIRECIEMPKNFGILVTMSEEKTFALPPAGIIAVYLILYDRGASFIYGMLAESYGFSSVEDEHQDCSVKMIDLEDIKRTYWSNSASTRQKKVKLEDGKKWKNKAAIQTWKNELNTDRLQLEVDVEELDADSKEEEDDDEDSEYKLKAVYVVLKFVATELYDDLCKANEFMQKALVH